MRQIICRLEDNELAWVLVSDIFFLNELIWAWIHSFKLSNRELAWAFWDLLLGF